MVNQVSSVTGAQTATCSHLTERSEAPNPRITAAERVKLFTNRQQLRTS
jgi:hypothetical protein